MASRRVTVRGKVTVRQTIRVQRTVRVASRQQLSQQEHRSISTAGSARALPRAPQAPGLVDDGYGPIDDPAREFDLFLSHATEDKEFVRPLAKALGGARD